jgi:ABC-type antimicrobial peptide transport system permease subunit
LQQVDNLPLILGGLLALLATVAVGHAVILGIRRRRRELAVLRTIGFRRRDVRAAIAYQSTILAALGLAVGIVAGVVVGRLVWRAVADGLGVEAQFDLSVLAVALVALGGIVVANVIGAIAAQAAIRDRPATALAVE